MSDELRRALETSKNHKQELVKVTGAGEIDDITPMVVLERMRHIVAVVIARQVDRDEGLLALHLGVPGYAADAATFVVDAHFSHSATNPATGEPWGPKEMQHACDHEEACDIGVTQDCLFAIRYERRTKKFQAINAPYHVDKKNRTVHWLEPQPWTEADTGVSLDGVVPDDIREAFNRATDAEITGRSQTLLDGATTILLSGAGFSVAGQIIGF